MRGRDLLQTGRRLLDAAGCEQREEDLRSVASRCYYALFLSTVEQLESGGAVLTGRGDDHAIVTEALSELARSQLALRPLERTFRRSGTMRREADYRLATSAVVFSKPLMEGMWEECTRAVALLDTHGKTIQKLGPGATAAATRRVLGRR